MKCEADMLGDIAVLTLSGELDTRGNAQVDKLLRDLASRGVYKVILDLSQIRFLGSQTLSMLLSNMKEMRAGGGHIKLLNPQKSVQQYLKQNRMFELFDIYTTRGEAVASFDPQPPKSASAHLKPTISEPESSDEAVASQLEAGEILHANSCMIVSLIKTLQNKGMLSPQEAKELLDQERLSLKGVAE